MYIEPFDTLVDIDRFGAKGYHLSKMKKQGFPIPDGFGISTKAFSKYFIDKNDISELIPIIEKELNRINASSYMVRSSAIGEDSDDNSFAGQLDSFISSNDINEIISNILKCWNSYQNENVQAYEKLTNKKLNGMGIVIQELINPDFAGVIFTRSHLKEDHFLIEYVTGHGEQLVSGDVTPKSFHYSFKSKTKEKDYLSELEHGLEIAQQIELFYGYPTDIEWAIENNNFFVVQARPITTKLKEKDVYWSNTNVNENYPDPISPLLYSIAREAYYNYFKNLSKLFCISSDEIRRLEGSFSNVIGVFGCKMYYNMTSIHEILSASPFSEALIKSFDNFVGYMDNTTENKAKTGFSEKIGFIRKFIHQNKILKENVIEFESFVDTYSTDVKEMIVFEDIRKCFHGFIEIRMHSWYRASLADFFAMTFHSLLGKFCAKYYGDEAVGIQNQLIQAIPGLISSKPVIEMYSILTQIRDNSEVYQSFQKLSSVEFVSWIQNNENAKSISTSIHIYLENWGFRCSGELMLTSKNYIEEPESFIDLLKQYEKLPEQDPEKIIQVKYKESLQIKKEFLKNIYRKNKWNLPKALFHSFLLNYLIKKAVDGISSRERVRLKQAFIYFRFKQVIKKVETEFINRELIENKDDILFLTHSEIAENLDASAIYHRNLKTIINEKKIEFKAQSELIYPDDFYTLRGEYLSPENVKKKTVDANNNGALNGLCACGGYIKGTAKVLNSVMEAGKLEKGDILITRQTDPGWVVVFPLISGLIVERGGMLSHGAIVSREFGIPAIVGVESATSLIKDGDIIILNADKGEITICV